MKDVMIDRCWLAYGYIRDPQGIPGLIPPFSPHHDAIMCAYGQSLKPAVEPYLSPPTDKDFYFLYNVARFSDASVIFGYRVI